VKNKFIIPLLFVSIVLLSSCAFGGVKGIIGDEDKAADDKMTQVLNAINNKNKESMRELFSEQALNESDDFDNSVDCLFEFFQGDV
jgi:hypothetical protein